MGLKYKKRKKTFAVKNKKVKSKEKSSKKIQLTEEKEFLQIGYRFKNNNESWLTIELNENCSLQESYKIIEKELEEMFGEDVMYFLPIYIEKEKENCSVFQFFPGYIFIKCSETVSVNDFKKTDHLEKILYEGSHPSFVTNRDINKFKTKIKLELLKRLPAIGYKVLVKEGVFKNQEGTVKSINRREKTAIIEFRKRTRIVTAKLSVISFEVKNE